ncbi:aminodeoxychorismate/anthranilate synthase component II [Clostridium gelidum]|uniref:Aminodeoxychorismate/anthranilate synthase component II n=1 Tax=Clostridium gelidum TaxID=704125 RepID=A0ABM7T2H1_9CLOT|nr:aminodeoxychorismate/anthranilate synthase component II [Clostridium gelidum]BCZ45358.1 aminodeoxychorismate/anthranilate synthase component II [Clostridium gelidum]
MLLMIDNYDSFVYNLVRYFEEIGEQVEVVRNDKINMNTIDMNKYLGIVISPGPKNPKEAGLSLDIIDKFKGKIPILGICLGHQCIGHYFGGQIIKGEKPMHGKISEVIHNNNGLFYNVKRPVKVTRYHSLIVNKETLPKELEIIAESSDNVIMGIKHKKLPIYGVQFHPEAELTEEGHKILENFIIECKRFKND